VNLLPSTEVCEPLEITNVSRAWRPEPAPFLFVVLEIPSGLQNFFTASVTVMTGVLFFAPMDDSQVAIAIASVDKLFAANAALVGGASSRG